MISMSAFPAAKPNKKITSTSALSEGSRMIRIASYVIHALTAIRAVTENRGMPVRRELVKRKEQRGKSEKRGRGKVYFRS